MSRPGRIWGLPVVLQWGCAEQEAIAAAPDPAPVSVTVVHVHHHHYVHAPTVGGIVPGPRVIEAVLQPQDAITEGKTERNE